MIQFTRFCIKWIICYYIFYCTNIVIIYTNKNHIVIVQNFGLKKKSVMNEIKIYIKYFFFYILFKTMNQLSSWDLNAKNNQNLMFGFSVEVKLILEPPYKEFYECFIICLFI